jgi:hypothetical protein
MTDFENQAQQEEQEQKNMNIYQRMLAIMGELKYIQKEDKKVNNQYSFVGHDAVTARCHEMFVKHGVYCLPDVKEYRQDGNRTEVIIDMTFINIDQPEDKFVISTFGYGVDNQDKGPGKAVSYAYKYGLLKAFALETGDDPEKDNIDYAGELQKAIKQHQATIDVIKEGIATGELGKAAEAWYELTEDEMKSIWVAPSKNGPFTTEERRVMKTAEFREAHFGTNKEVAA